MENALLVGLSRQVALQRELDVVANNVANINTTGFKADRCVFEEYLMPDGAAPTRSTRPDQPRRPSCVDRGTWHRLHARARSSRPATRSTSRSTATAFLVVQTPRGERYTRNGALQINSTRPARHQRRQHGARRQRPDHVSAPTRPSIAIGAGRHRSRVPKASKGKLAASCAGRRNPQQLQKDGVNTFTRRPTPRAAAGHATSASSPGLGREIERQRRRRDEPR